MKFDTEPKPVSVYDITRTRYRRTCTVCQKLREIYRLTDSEDAKLKCRIAMAMAKSMNDKLKEYKETFDPDVYDIMYGLPEELEEG